MAESEGSGEASVDDPLADPADTDQQGVDPSGDADSGANGAGLGYPFDEPDHPVPTYAGRLEPEPPPGERAFNAFDARTWNFHPATTPWYRTGHTAVVVFVVSIAVIALIVSIVLLAFRGSSGEPTTPGVFTTTAPPATTALPVTSDVPLPPLPPSPPPAPDPSASQISRAPVVAPPPPRPTKKPELNVTRSPLSVSPQRPSR